MGRMGQMEPLLLPAPAGGEAYELMLPGDVGWAEYQWTMARRRAEHLSNHGWKFTKAVGPRGTYYEGHGPQGKRVMSEQQADERAAFVAAINHAFAVQF
jgi:hypothetical protein